jgi:3-hydroxyisobutyrate dehydrogenase-like beta-hydroxyacid dehydrogenase
MASKTITVLNPGDMGSSIGGCARSAGNRVLWVREGRSADTVARADAEQLEATDTLKEALANSDVVLSICPPHAAIATAEAVAANGFTGLYIDANAVSPSTVATVSKTVQAVGARYCDGGIIGPPITQGRETKLYLAGPHTDEAAQLFNGSPVQTIILDGPDDAASALKMCYAAWTKCTIGLLANIRALAGALDVEEALLDEWNRSQPGLADRSENNVRNSAFKAWRWIAEMNEIADSFKHAGLPDDFHRGAAHVFERQASFKNDRHPQLAAIIDAMIENKD